jgi:hypothetical protein
MWGYGYKGIRMTNEFLSRVDKVKKLEMAQKSGKDLETVLAQMKQRTAEMKFLRAFYHFYISQYFGGIPVADHVLSGQDFTKTRDDIATVLHFVENDLHEAIPDLPLKSQLDGAQIGRATQVQPGIIGKGLPVRIVVCRKLPGRLPFWRLRSALRFSFKQC